MTRGLGLALAAAGWVCLAGDAGAFVSSATLEYSADNQLEIFLNGKQLLKRSEMNGEDYALLSTSDGSLPITLFDAGGDNVLAFENSDGIGGHMGASFRLTVHSEQTSAVLVWSQPGVARFMHLRQAEKDPEGWFDQKFDDSAWPMAAEGNILRGDPTQFWACLSDPAFSALGAMGCVPFISHRPDAHSVIHDHNLMRSHFKIPNASAMRVAANPAASAQGRTLSLRIYPGREALNHDHFQLWAGVPQGLKISSLSKGGHSDSSSATWDFSLADTGLGYLSLTARSVLLSHAWTQPEKALGAFKEGKAIDRLKPVSLVAKDGAKFGPGNPGWFAMQAPQGLPAGAEIAGLVFHSQMRLGGRDSFHVADTDPVYFNYSLDGTLNGSLKEDVLVSRAAGDYNWFDAYYDASEDRHWTLRDLSELRVKFEGRQRRLKDTNMLASISAVVRYFLPLNCSPYYYASVLEPQCKALRISASISSSGIPTLTSAPLTITVNGGKCK